MGNALSDNEEETKADCSANVDDDLSDGENDGDEDHKPLTDLSQLYGDSAALRSAATKVKEKLPENAILQNHAHIMSWLVSRHERSEDSVTLAQFCDMMMNHGVERPDASKAFQQLDCDGSGVADVETMMIALETYSSRSALGELGKSIRILQSCSLTPGFVDVFEGNGNAVEKHGTRMLQYLIRNRVESNAMPFSHLGSFHNIHTMRASVLHASLLSQNLTDKEPEADMEREDYEKRTIDNCYTHLEVSSNYSDCHLLRHPSMYWQSDGAARSHWIRIHVKPQVVIKHLSVGVSSSDQSYMPEQVTISIGHSAVRLREIKEVKVQNHVSGQVVLLKNMKAHYPFIQINIKRCHGDGCDTRIHGIKMTGYKMVKDAGISVMDASALWYLQMLTSTVSFTLPQSPALRAMLLAHTKKALETMPPLSLSTASPDRPTFLNKHVLQEMDSFTALLAQSDNADKPSEEGIQVQLALNLARGSVAGLVKMVTSFISLKELNLPCADLLSKTLATRYVCWDKVAYPLTVKCEGSDGGRGPLNIGPEVVLEAQNSSTNLRDGSAASTSSSRVYQTEEGKTSCTMIFRAEENVQLSKIRIQVASGMKGPRHGLVFVYNPEMIEELSSKFDFDEHIKYFSKYDFWGDTEFKFSIEYRDGGLGGLPDNPVAFFKFEQDWDELEIPVKWSAVGRYIMVKFLDPRYAVATRLGIVSVKFFGIPRPSPWSRDIEKSVVVSNNPKKTSCGLSEIVLVILTFISDIAIDQLKRRNRSSKPQNEFLDLSELDVMTLWNLHLICADCQKQAITQGSSSKVVEQWQQSSLLAIQLIHGLIPVLASSKVTTQASRDSLFQELCRFINQEGKTDQGSETTEIKTDASSKHKLMLIQQIIIDGAPLFFPEKTKKRNELFKLLEFISDQSSQPSTSLVFQSLCQFFSTVDPKGLLELPSTPPKDFNPANALGMMKSLLMVACQEAMTFIMSESPKPEKSDSEEAGVAQTDASVKENNVGNKRNTGDNKPGAQSDGDGDGDENKDTKASGGSTASSAATPMTSVDGTKDTAVNQTETNKTNAINNVESEKLNSASSNTDHNKGDNKSSSSQKESGKNLKEKETTVSKSSAGQHKMTYLVKLTCSLQAALMTWCWQQLNQLNAQDNEDLVETVNVIVGSYTKQMMENASQCLEVLKNISGEQLAIKAGMGEPSFLFDIVRQQCLFLSTLVDKINTETKVNVLESCKKFLNLASLLAKVHPELFSDIIQAKENPSLTEETVLRTWEVESPHDYLNHSNINQMFHCPGASKFLIDFDPRCETERRYDYLEFVDAKGLKMRFDHKVGSTKWPKQVNFSGPHVSFLFRSDSSNTEWGYKFTVTAKGSPDVPFSWLMDLHLGLVKVLGKLCGATLGSNPILPSESTTTPEDSGCEQDILRSDLWTSLFRGGYRVEGKLQRSLSGKFATGVDSEIHSFLLEVVRQAGRPKDQEPVDPEETMKVQVAKFLAKCHEADVTKSQTKAGGPEVNKALKSVFVALVWHCQQLREDVDKFIQTSGQGEISEGIVKAYGTAESVRIQVASQRQRWNTLEDKDGAQDPAEVLLSKCMFLLKFAGLTKVQLKNELRSKFYKQMMLKKAGNKPVIRNEVLDKYPSFRLVMEFVQDPAWTSQRVHQLLQERTKFASAIRDVYMFASEAMRTLSDDSPFQISIVLFLQEMFGYQSKFAIHYADGLDGCGLQQESQVRQAYYTLVRILVDAFKKQKALPADSPSYLVSAYDMIQCCLLHLLDVEWQPYDLSFVNDLSLPQLYFRIAKETVKMRDLNESEQNVEELKEYEQTMKWYSEVSQGLGSWFRKKEKDSTEDKKAVKMFIARFSDVLDVEISCDGCNVTLPGCRYRCLQCLDMDLCEACFSGGVEPEEHRDDHEIVHLRYRCNHCQAFIMGKRIHCNQCDDFDLCLGCHTKGKFPSGHSQDHDVTFYPMVKLKTSQSSNSLLRAYIHQHSWLLYTSLTLTLSDLVYGQDNGYSFLDPDYIRVAGQLQTQCVALATQCLQHNLDVENEKDLPTERRMEESFARHSQERIMGLLGAVMPMQEKRDLMSGSGFNFWTQEFLDLLLCVSKGDHSHELNTQQQGLRLMGRLLKTAELPSTTTPITPTTPATPTSPGAESVPSTVSQDKQLLAGKDTIGHLFTYGAKEFERHGLEWACSAARMLEMLFASSQWRPVINSHVTQCVQNLQEKVDLACIFPMFVIAGFPEVLTTGTLVEYNNTFVDKQKGVVLKHFPDKYQTLVVNLATRKRHTVMDQYVICYTEKTDMWETGSLGKFVEYVIHTVGKIRAGEELSVEVLWALSLALKVLDRCLKDSQEVGSVEQEVSSSAFIQSLVFLACKGTSLNHHWLLRDLEVLSLIWYTQDGNISKKTKITNLKEKKDGKKRKKGAERGKESKKDSDDEDHINMAVLEDDDDDDDGDKDDVFKIKNKDYDDDDDYKSSSSSSSSSDEDDSAFDHDDDDSFWETTSGSNDDDDDDGNEDGTVDDGAKVIKNDDDDENELNALLESCTVEEGIRELFEDLIGELRFDPSVLAALCSMSDGKTNEIIKSLIENAADKEAVTLVIEKWKKKRAASLEGKKDTPAHTETASIDTGISVHTTVGTRHKIPDVAEKEKGFNLQNLFTHQDKLEGAIRKKQRAWSSTLFRKELDKHGQSGSREYLLKINMAMCVLYARHTLTGLLAQWPDTGPAINSSLLGCKDVKQIPCVLDLLHKIDSRDFFSKVVDKVIHLCDESSLVAIAYTAAQFMEEVTLSAVTRESAHNYTETDRKKGHITLPGASYLTVTFDSRCTTAEEDYVLFSTRQQMDKDRHAFFGLSRDCWTSFHLPGDTLYYKFVLDNFDSDEPSHWGYKFTVTAGTRNSFETGQTILDAVLSSNIARSLPLGQLWSSLVYVSVKQAGLQRLKAIHLMLKILALEHKADQKDQSKTTPDIDLCLLRPLWELYESLNTEANDSSMLQPAAVGALTDLFLKVEELVSEWGLTQEYLVSLISRNHLQTVFIQGLKNVTTVGHDIGWQDDTIDAMNGPKAAEIEKAICDAFSGKKNNPPSTKS